MPPSVATAPPVMGLLSAGQLFEGAMPGLVIRTWNPSPGGWGRVTQSSPCLRGKGGERRGSVRTGVRALLPRETDMEVARRQLVY